MAIIKETNEPYQLMSYSVDIRREFGGVVDGRATAKNPKIIMDVSRVGLETGRVSHHETIIIDPAKLSPETAQALYNIQGALVAAFEEHYPDAEQEQPTEGETI